MGGQLLGGRHASICNYPLDKNLFFEEHAEMKNKKYGSKADL